MTLSNADYDVAYCDDCERCHLNGICPQDSAMANDANREMAYLKVKIGATNEPQSYWLAPDLRGQFLGPITPEQAERYEEEE